MFFANKLGCSDKTVAPVRAELETTAEIPQLDRLGRDSYGPRRITGPSALTGPSTFG
jgi:hypothetical protein